MSDHATTESSNTVLAQPRSWDRWRGRLAWIITGISVVVDAVAHNRANVSEDNG